MDRFDALQAFVRVVEAGSFTKAAQTLHMSKTTVSQLIQQLENRLRVRLLNRTTRKVQVTADGEAYYARVVRLLADLKDADASLSGGAAVPSGRLRVDAPSPFALMVLVPGLPEFHAQYPEIQLDLGVSDRMVDVIGDNVDGVIRGGELPDSTLIARRIAELPFGFYAAPAYLERVGRPAHPLELEAAPHRVVGFLSARSATVAPMVMEREGERVRLRGRYAVALDDGNACLAAGLAGMGVLCLPSYMAQESVKRGELATLFEDWRVEPMPLHLLLPPNRHISAKLRVFIAWVEARIARQAGIVSV